MPASITEDARARRVIEFFENLKPEDLAQLDQFYTDDARFKDPFNEVRGLAQVRRVFEHMFSALDGPRFFVTDAIVEGRHCFLVWDFQFRFRRGSSDLQTVRGGSHVGFSENGRIAMHRDYWDAAEELYEKLPVVGALMRWLKRRVAG